MRNFFGKGAIALAVLLLGICCGDSDDAGCGIPKPEANGLVVTLSSSIILADGEDSTTVTVTYNDEVIPVSNPDLLYFDAATAKSIEKFDTYTTTTEGKFLFYVTYKSESTKATPTMIRACNVAIPERVADPQPENLDFAHRAMLIQFTGTDCPNCPRMIRAIREVKEDALYAERIVHAAIHSYNGSDPCNIILPGPRVMQDAMGVGSYPYLMVDACLSSGSEASLIKDAIDRRLSTPAKAGIAANIVVEDELIVIRATVKAAEGGNYRIGAWVLEDDIEAEQQNNGTSGDYNIHHNAVRFADSQRSSYDVMGHDLGGVPTGGYVDHIFTIDTSIVGATGCRIADLSKCHLLLFVTTTTDDTTHVVNAIDTPATSGTVTYAYE